PPGTDATVQGSPSRSASRSQLVRHSPTIWSRVCSRKMWGWVREWLPMIWPDRRSERIPAASRKVRSPMRLVMMKKWPRQPRLAFRAHEELPEGPQESEPVAHVHDREHECECDGAAEACVAPGGDRARQHDEQIGGGRRTEQQAGQADPGAQGGGRRQQQHERGWDELPGRHHGPHLAGYERLGVAVLVVHPGYLRERIPGEVVGDHVGREQDAPPPL